MSFQKLLSGCANLLLSTKGRPSYIREQTDLLSPVLVMVGKVAFGDLQLP